MTIHRKATPRKKRFAKKLRRKLTRAECAFWEICQTLKTEGVIFWRQVVLCGYVADFWCPKLKLVVEIDGDSHLSESAQSYDRHRARVMRDKHEAKTVRFTNFEVINNPAIVEAKLREVIRQRSVMLS
jgi:very-short-patch-repair endonuclease